MQFLIDQWTNPATRYGYLGAIAAFSISSSLTTLPWLAVFGTSIGVGLVLSVSIQIVRYFKSITDEAKNTLTELQDTLKEAQDAVEKVSKEFEDAPPGQKPTIMQNVKKVVSRVTKELDEAQEGQEPTIMQNVKSTVAEVKDAMSKVNRELGEAKEGEKPTLAQTVKQTLGEVNETVDQGRSGWAGWFLNLNKKASSQKASDPKVLAPKQAKPVLNKSPKAPDRPIKALASEQVDHAAVDSLLATFDQPANNRTAQQLYEQGVKALRRKRFPQALEDFKKVESLHPKSDEADLARLQMIKCYFSTNDHARALTIAEHFIRSKPKHLDVDYAYYMKAMIHFEAYLRAKDKKPELAKKALDAFAALSKKFPESEYTAGSKDEITELEGIIKAKPQKLVEGLKAQKIPPATKTAEPAQSWSAWAKSWVPSFSLFGENKATSAKATQPVMRKSPRLAAQKN